MKRMFVAAVLIAALATSAAAQHQHGAGTASPATPPLFKGLGPVEHTVTTSDPLAQKFFNQGLRLAYAFNHDEAGRAFREAARLDSTCAMAYWGAALVLGPNINLPMSPEAEQAAYAALERAKSFSARASEPERAYIQALSARYDRTPGANRAAHDSAYADAMRGLMKRYPDDDDAAVLCAEALMDLRPWDLWTLDGRAQPGTPEIVAILETVIKRNSNHSAALHYYIHAVEASPEPGRAEPAAERLAKLAPDAGHLVHVPSHIYLRLGRYEEGAQINSRAISVDRDYITKYDVKGVYPAMYYPHNIHMRWSALCSSGQRAEALAGARDLTAVISDSLVRAMPMVEFFRAPLYLTYARFGLWEEVLKLPSPPADLRATAAVWQYARGLALAATGKPAGAKAARDSVASIGASLPAEVYFGLNPVGPVLRFAAAMLSGEIAARSGDTGEAIRLLREAAGVQDSLRYDEPPPWNATARQSLGVVLLQANRPAEAEAAYREDLARNPNNGWSLYGLTQSLRAQKKAQEADATEKRFRKAWGNADVRLSASRY